MHFQRILSDGIHASIEFELIFRSLSQAETAEKKLLSLKADPEVAQNFTQLLARELKVSGITPPSDLDVHVMVLPRIVSYFEPRFTTKTNVAFAFTMAFRTARQASDNRKVLNTITKSRKIGVA